MFVSIFFFTFLLYVNSCPSQHTGDRAWTDLGDSCYSISKQPMNWAVAQEVTTDDYYILMFFLFIVIFFKYCWNQGGYLAEITTAEEEMLLETFLIEGVTYWLGFSDLIYEGFERNTNPNCPHMLAFQAHTDGRRVTS